MQTCYIIPIKKREQVLRDAMQVATGIWVDQLDCSVSIYRRDTDKTIEEVLKLGLSDSRTMYHFIFRGPVEDRLAYFDIGLSTCTGTGVGPEYFLWIKTTVEKAQWLIKRWEIKTTVEKAQWLIKRWGIKRNR